MSFHLQYGFFFTLSLEKMTQHKWVDNLVLLVVKRILPMRIVKFVWFQRLSYKLYLWIVFPSKKDFFLNVLPSLVENEFVCVAYIGWLFIYHLQIQFIDVKRNKWHFFCGCQHISSNWEVKHVIIGRFEVINTSGTPMASKLYELLNKFVLIQTIVAYVKDEGSNL
jgi:hypothetical protein